MRTQLPANASLRIDLDASNDAPIDYQTEITRACELAVNLGIPVDLVRGHASERIIHSILDDYDERLRIETALRSAKTPPEPDSVFLSMRSGASYFPLAGESRPNIPLDDLIVGLSRTARFNGQSKDFYSVAQHCVLVAQRVFELTGGDPESTFKALVHDCSEAFTGDMVSPLKALLPDFRQLEKKIENHIDQYFGLGHVDYAVIRRGDLELLATEKRDQMPNSHEDWSILDGIEPLPIRIDGLPPDAAYDLYINAFNSARDLVLQHRAKQVASLQTATEFLQQQDFASEECCAVAMQALQGINTNSPSDAVIDALDAMHSALSDHMSRIGFNKAVANSVFMGRATPDALGKGGEGATAVLRVMAVCGDVSRKVYEKAARPLLSATAPLERRSSPVARPTRPDCLEFD